MVISFKMFRSGQTGLDASALGIGSRKIPHVAGNSPRLRVLVVDDEPLIRWSIAETLEQAGHEVVEAGDARNAIRLMSAAEPFDVVLLDYRLPDSNDLTLLATIRTLGPAGAVIMMTAFGTPEVLTGALALGAYQVIAKPFEVDDVAALVLQAHLAPR
jgi:DNA-binding NtrC family response regulator